MRINIEDFFEEQHLRFKNDRQGVNWVKRNLKPRSLLRIGPNYLVDKKEINKLFNDYIKYQQDLSESRAKLAKTLSKKKKQKKPPE